MAYAEFGAFRPSESSYVNPGEYEATQRSIALEKATYLSTMDQFYQDLEERGREYDLSLAFEKEKFGKSLAFEERQFQQTLGFEQEKFAQTLGFEEEKQAFAESSWSQEFEESIREFDVQAKLKKKEIELMSQAQSSSETSDMFGNIFGGIGAIDTISSWF